MSSDAIAQPDLSIVVACYNEACHLEQSIDELVATLDCTRWAYELIFVEDCSTDDTRAVLERVVQKYADRSIQVIYHDKNTGRGRTVTDGIHAARGAVVGFLDIDLEVHARYIPACVLAIEQGADIATAKREYKLTIWLFYRHVLSRGYVAMVQSWLGTRLSDTESGYKFFKRDRILPVLAETRDPGWFWDTEIMLRAEAAGLAIVEIPSLFIRRYDKKSTVRIVRDTIDYLRKTWHFRKVMRELRARQNVAGLAERENS
jgi:glycosyltransferase involved in cell wall biosynthesis